MTDWLPFLCVGVLIHLAHALYRAHVRLQQMADRLTHLEEFVFERDAALREMFLYIKKADRD